MVDNRWCIRPDMILLVSVQAGPDWTSMWVQENVFAAME
jgi:hypothetical protein